MEFEVVGQGGHAAMLDEARDPIPACAALVQNVYASVARDSDLREDRAVLVSFTQIQVRRLRDNDSETSAALALRANRIRRSGKSGSL